MASVFIPNPNFIDALTKEDSVKEFMASSAESAKGIAQVSAPRGDGPVHYADQFVVVEDEAGNTVLGNTDWKSHWMEWGTIHTPPQAVIRRAVMAAGYRLQEEPRE